MQKTQPPIPPLNEECYWECLDDLWKVKYSKNFTTRQLYEAARAKFPKMSLLTNPAETEQFLNLAVTKGAVEISIAPGVVHYRLKLFAPAEEI